MKRLIQVVRRRGERGTTFMFQNGERLPSRQEPVALIPQPVNEEFGDFVRQAEFFLAREDDVEFMVNILAQYNPGCEVRVYAIESSAQTTVGPVVHKRVTKDGVLPSTEAAVGQAQAVPEARARDRAWLNVNEAPVQRLDNEIEQMLDAELRDGEERF